MSAGLLPLRHQRGAFLHDVLTIPFAWLGAYWLRFNLETPPLLYLKPGLLALALLIPLQALMFWKFGLYRGVWRFTSLADLLRIFKAVASGSISAVGVLFVLTRLHDIPRSVPMLFALLQLTLLIGPRLLYRWMQDPHLGFNQGRRVLIVGSGGAGEMLVRDMLRDPLRAYQPLAFVDDNPRRQGSDIHGIPVRGVCADIPNLVHQLAIEIVVLAIPSASSMQMRRLVAICESANVPFRTVPKLRDLMDSQVSLAQLQAVSIEDLLGRDPVHLDWKAIHSGLTGRCILVTGGGGSIGAELCRQLAQIAPLRLAIFEQCEFNLYTIEQDLRQRFPALDLITRLGDVADAVAVAQLFHAVRPQIVFHAAAYKHVPLLENQAREAARINVLGTRCIAEAARMYACQEFVLISTDKAVHPANVMGATKRLAECYGQRMSSDGKTRFITVRFGNVLDSAGSVVPLFRRQIAQGGPVTITHPEMERFFMTIPEACQLILQAGVIGRSGDILVLDMGQPIRIGYLAEQMIRLAGRDPATLPIQYIGLRPGEKLHEELFYRDEDLLPTPHPRIRIAHHRPLNTQHLDQGLINLEAAVQAYDTAAVVAALQALVPEWQSVPTAAIQA